ncbi:MAG: hypothetical protein JWO13_730 [Acidobacteriales bacterium]|nr:hypothetical protein [Terriglobales bacterium]
MKSVMIVSLAFALSWQLGCKQHIAREKNPKDVPPKQVEKAAQSFTDENTFFQRTAAALTTEIEAAKLAQSKAQSPDVKAHAERELKDYTTMLNNLQKLAQSKSVSVPNGNADNETVSNLQSKSGGDFDTAYAGTEVDGTQEVVTLLQGAIEKAQDPRIKDFATVNLITARDYADEANALEKKVGGGLLKR